MTFQVGDTVELTDDAKALCRIVPDTHEWQRKLQSLWTITNIYSRSDDQFAGSFILRDIVITLQEIGSGFTTTVMDYDIQLVEGEVIP